MCIRDRDFTDVRGMEGIKEATYPVAGLEVKVAIASGLGNARKLLEKVKSGEATYHFIEIMGCPGGCINGGGQPQQDVYKRQGMACVGGCVGGPSKHKTELEAKKARDLLIGQADDREVHANLKNLGVEQVAMHRH